MTVGTSNLHRTSAFLVDASTSSAVGYKFTYRGTAQRFNTTTTPRG